MADDATKKARTEAQIKLADELQDLVLADLKKILDNGTATATDRATIIRLLRDNGWNLDPSRLTTSLKDKLTNKVRFDEDLTEEETGTRGQIRIA